MIKAASLSFEKKKTPFDSKTKYYKNGEDNRYGETQELLINNSVTSKTASGIQVQYIIGDGYGPNDDLVVDDIKHTSLYELAFRAIESKVKQRGVFYHVKYNANFEKDSISVIPFNHCRIGKKDDLDYNGKIFVSRDFFDNKITPHVIDVYNPDPQVIERQVRKQSNNSSEPLTESDWNNYKGQVLFVNDDYQYIYPTSRIDAVRKDCDSEYQASLYKNKSLRSGSFGKTVVITPPLVDDDIQKFVYDDDGKEVINPEYRKAESERENFKTTISTFFGAENTGDGIHIETDFEGEDLEKAFLIKNYKSDINDKLFEFTEKSTRRNILFAFNNLPVMLVEPSEGVFSSSGETFRQAQLMYWRNNKRERSSIEKTLTELLSNFKGKNYIIKTQSLFAENQNTEEDDNNQMD